MDIMGTSAAPAPEQTGTQEQNLLIDHYDRLPRTADECGIDRTPTVGGAQFSPGFHLPLLDDDVRHFLSVAKAHWLPLAPYRDHRVFLLDLTANPGTQTTKTLASLLIVARAVEYIRRSGEPVLIFSPTSANKGVGLRDAVLRALDAGLVRPDQLRVVTLAPVSCLPKLRSSALSRDERLRRLNPVLVYTGEQPEDVKRLGREFAARHAAVIRRTRSTNVWFSLELANYLVADTTRAFFEQRVHPVDDGPRRVHAHAVSSAFGLLGYHRGREILERDGVSAQRNRPESLLVQHLGTPDMVLGLRHGSFDRSLVPRYHHDAASGLFTQHSDPRFPAHTYSPVEVLDPTFYTRRPPTSEAMNRIIEQFGGDGIVVSLAECVARYPYLRTFLLDERYRLPADFRTLREWSLVMALTGVLHAVDRRLIAPGRDVVVHGSGCYADEDYEVIEAGAVTAVATADQVAEAVAHGDEAR